MPEKRVLLVGCLMQVIKVFQTAGQTSTAINMLTLPVPLLQHTVVAAYGGC